jgi:hypothetical protein
MNGTNMAGSPSTATTSVMSPDDDRWVRVLRGGPQSVRSTILGARRGAVVHAGFWSSPYSLRTHRMRLRFLRIGRRSIASPCRGSRWPTRRPGTAAVRLARYSPPRNDVQKHHAERRYQIADGLDDRRFHALLVAISSWLPTRREHDSLNLVKRWVMGSCHGSIMPSERNRLADREPQRGAMTRHGGERR